MNIIEKNTFRIIDIDEIALSTFSCELYAIVGFSKPENYDNEFVLSLNYSDKNGIFDIATELVYKSISKIREIKYQRRVNEYKRVVYERFGGFKYMITVGFPYLEEHYAPIYKAAINEGNPRIITYDENLNQIITSFWNNILPQFRQVIENDPEFQLFELDIELAKAEKNAEIEIIIGEAKPETPIQFIVENFGPEIDCEIEIFKDNISFLLPFVGIIGRAVFTVTLPQGDFYIKVIDNEVVIKETSFIVR